MKYCLWLIIILGIVLRLYNFGNIPVGLNRDEAALGYNAFTIANFGMDEWGNKYPLTFISFGDYKLPGYVYALAPLIKVFGVHDWVIRLPSLIAGLVLILIALKIGGKWAAALTAISPYAIFYSRTAYEANFSLMWLGITIWLLLKPAKWWHFAGIFISYFMAVVTYNTPLLVAPFLIIFSWFINKQPVKFKAISSLIILTIATISWWQLSSLTSQKAGITIFQDPTIQAQIREDYHKANTVPEKVLAHQYTYYAKWVAGKMAESLSPKFLVVKGGDHPWHTVPGTGLITMTGYLWFWLVLGLVAIKKLVLKRESLGLLFLGIGSLLPSLLTVDAPHATRSLLFLWISGMWMTTQTIKLKRWQWLVTILLLIEGGMYGYKYFFVYPKTQPETWPKIIEQVIQKAEAIRAPNQQIQIANAPESNADLVSEQLYIYALLYSQNRPGEAGAFANTTKDAANLVRVNQVGHYIISGQLTDSLPNKPLVIERLTEGRYRLQ